MELKNFKEALIAHLQGEEVLMRHVASGCVNDFAAIFNTHTLQSLLDFADSIYIFSLAPRTITVNGVEVPAPESVAPEEGSKYFNPNAFMDEMFSFEEWIGSASNFRELERGLVYLNKDDAIARAKAMLKYEEDK